MPAHSAEQQASVTPGQSPAASPSVVQQQAARAAAEFFQKNGGDDAPVIIRKALSTFLAARQFYLAGQYRECQKVLDELWREYPSSSAVWGQAHRKQVFNLGQPHCYPALLMLTECCRWQLRAPRAAVTSHEVTLGVILIGRSKGIQAQSKAELDADTGTEVTHDLHPSLLANNHQVIHNALWLFGEYVQAMTDGRLKLKVQVTHLPDLVVPVHTTLRGARVAFADITPRGLADLWPDIQRRVKPTPEWWWIIYPSHVPDASPDFKRAEFVTGGMGRGPDGSSPGFICDDLWLVRRPPHLGQGLYTDTEVLIYLPQWFQHEVFHHLFAAYPEFELEKTGHQWHNRKTWPTDFQGLFEPDYYGEALRKRLQPQGTPPLHVKLRYVPPLASVLARIRPESLVGFYRHSPVQNPWHEGTISLAGRGANGDIIFKWENRAGISWRLLPDLPSGSLLTSSDNPYFKENTQASRTFRLELKRDADGNYLPEPLGFHFNGTFYSREP